MLIAEVGLNHLGDEKIAMKYVSSVVNSDIDAITFQVLGDSFFNNDKYSGCQLRNEFFLEALFQTKRGNKKYGIAIDTEALMSLFVEHNLDLSFCFLQH